MTASVLLLIATCVLILPSISVIIEVPRETPRRIVCYYTISSLEAKDVDPTLCTHILIGFFLIKNNSIVISQSEANLIGEFIEMKKNNDVKIMISLGGGGALGFPEMVKNSSNRATFIQSTESTMSKLDLDGIDLDWEFPNSILTNDKKHFIQLLDELRQNVNNSTRKYLVSVAVAAPITIVEPSYDVPSINRLVDFVNLMSYDYNFFSYLTPWTGMNAPLYARSVDFFYFKTQNINFTAAYWIEKGMDKSKLNVGLPVYAHTYTLATLNKSYLGAPAIGNGKLGGGGSAGYGEVCNFMKQQNLEPVFDEETKSPYVTNGTEWVSFENEQSIQIKAEYVYDNNFGGVMVFSLSSDDYEGVCNPGQKFPNTKIIHKIFTLR